MAPRYQSRPSLVDAISRGGSFSKWFKGNSWDAWRIVLKAALALPMTQSEITFFRTVAGDRDPPHKQVKELWCVVGRSGGKDSIASVIAAWTAALFKPTNLRPGERALVCCLACDREQASTALDYTKAFFQQLPPLRGVVTSETQSGFKLSNRTDIAIATNSFRSIRGRSVLCAILDECAFYRDDKSATPDIGLYTALRPGLARVPGSILIGISTPHRKLGLLYDKFNRYYGKNHDDVLVIRAPTRVMNPSFPRGAVDTALAEDRVLNGAEYLAEFRDEIGGWLPRDLIEHAVDRGVIVRPPNATKRYTSFCDPSGGEHDSFTAAVAHKEDDLVILDALIEIKPPFDSQSATERIASLLKSYRLHSTTGDHYAATWVVDAFARCGITYKHSEEDRSEIYLNTLPLFTAGRVRLLDNARLVGQFCGLDRRAGPQGKDRVDHGRGGHDDLCNVAAGALLGVTSARPRVIFTADIIAQIDNPHFVPRATEKPASRRNPYIEHQIGRRLAVASLDLSDAELERAAVDLR